MDILESSNDLRTFIAMMQLILSPHNKESGLEGKPSDTESGILRLQGLHNNLSCMGGMPQRAFLSHH